MTESQTRTFTIEEYLELEARSHIRHEYVAGQVYAMTGATLTHASLVLSLGSLLLSHTKGSGCKPYVNDVKVHVELRDSIYYPDVLVRCGKQPTNDLLITDPVLLIEVLSRSTASIDRREKRLAYQTLDTLREYVLVSQRRQLIEVWRKTDAGKWESFKLGKGDSLVLRSMPAAGTFTASLEEIYSELDLPAGGFEVQEEEGDYDNW